MAGCDDFFEDDISNQVIELKYPADSLVYSEDEITFTWSTIGGATTYEFLIYRYQNNTIQELLFDTLLTTNTYSRVLEAGKYEWQVYAFNSAYQTPLSTKTLVLTQTVDNSLLDKEVSLLAPVNNYETKKNILSFWWEKVEGATSYQLQVVSPDFVSTEQLILNTIIPENSYTMELPEGEYEWRVCALDSNYQTPYTTRNFTVVIPENNFPDEHVNLIAPAANLETQKNTLSFWWEVVLNATSYHLQIVSPGFTSPQELILDTLVTVNSISYGLTEGQYEWRVCALDSVSKSETAYTIRNFAITIPVNDFPDQLVELLAPADDLETMTNNITFWWEALDEAVSYRLQIVSPDFSSPELMILDTEITSNSFTTSLDIGQYEWRVRAKNAEGQTTSYSSRNINIASDNSNSIENIRVTLLAPANEMETMTKTITFWWEDIENADSYIFQLVSPDFQDTEFLIAEEELTDNQITLTLEAGNYQWRVKALNSESETRYSTRSLTILPDLEELNE